MAGENFIYAYYQQIKNGTITAGRWIILIYDYIVNGIEQKQFYFDQKKANGVIEWIEANCFHTKGPRALEPFKLELWEKAFLSCLYGIVDENGARVFREVLLLVGRKNGKSALASCIGKYEWYIGGGYGAEVYTIAPKLEQAEIIYNNIWQQVVVDPEYKKLQERLEELRGTRKGSAHAKRFVEEMPRHRQTDLYLPVNNGTVKKIAFSARKSDGFGPSCVFCDEVAAWQGDAGLKQYEVLKSGMGARPEGIVLSCTTSGYENEGIFDELMKRATRFLLGDSKERRFLPLLYMIDDPEKWDDINELRKANPNLGVSVSVSYMLEEIAVAEGSLSKRAEFICKYANLKQNSSMAWLDAFDVEKCTGASLTFEEFKSTYAVCGVDLSQTTDLTAAVCVIERDGVYNVLAQFFIPAERVEELTARDGVPYMAYVQRGLLTLSGDNFINYRDVYAWITALIERYQIYPLKVGYDRYSAQYLIQDLNAYGFQTDDVFQGENLYPVIQEVGGLIKDGRINIGDNDLLKIHFLNSALKMSNERGRGKLIKINQNAHVDGMAALLCAFCMISKYHDEIGEQLKNGII